MVIKKKKENENIFVHFINYPPPFITTITVPKYNWHRSLLLTNENAISQINQQRSELPPMCMYEE